MSLRPFQTAASDDNLLNRLCRNRGVGLRRDDIRICVGLGRFGAVVHPQVKSAYFSPSWTPFQADRGRDFSVIVDGVSS